MNQSSIEVIDLGIDIDGTFDQSASIGLTEARKMLRGKGKGPVALETLRGWIDPRRGYRPSGPGGPRLVLPAVRIGGQFRLMAAWVEAFDAARVRLGLRR